jgi:hypothetical protein
MPWHLPGEVTDRSVVVYMTGTLCTQPAQVLQTNHAIKVLQNFINRLRKRRSAHLMVFGGIETAGDRENPSPAAEMLVRALALLVDMPCEEVRVRAPDCADLLDNPLAIAEFVEELYDHWRGYERYLIFEAATDHSRDHAIEGHEAFVFNNEDLSSLIREAYRRIEHNLRGHWPRVYRQTPAGTTMGLLIEHIDWDCPGGIYEQLKSIRMVRLALLVPPVVLYPRMTFRRGQFLKVDENPLNDLNLDTEQWLCIPLLVGELCIHFYFHPDYRALAISLVNLFELADHKQARRKPDMILLFGVPLEQMGRERTIFYVDEDHDMAVGVIGRSEEVDYFGYVKKMTLTLHNVIMMRRGRLPIHGAMANLRLREGPEKSIIIVGDTGTGKSESLEAFRMLAEDWISDTTIIFDDMGSLVLTKPGELLAYGTEIGAFVRLDDIDPGYAFGNFDRGIFMNPQFHNARLVLPITEYSRVVAGYPVSVLLYANNYEPVTESTPILEFFHTPEEALEIFRTGARVAKGTTEESGLVYSYFGNIFGPPQMRDVHEQLAHRYFIAAHELGVPIGQIRTRLGLEGMEREGPRLAAEALFRYLAEQAEHK